MFQLPTRLREILKVGPLRFATLWKIERKDGITLRLTDHDCKLVIAGDGTYSPSNSFRGSARERNIGLDQTNAEVSAVLDSSLITNEDLRVGRYRGAKITERVIDWTVPNEGYYCGIVYFVREIKWDGRKFIAQIGGWTDFLQQNIGRVITRGCDAELGSTRCGVNLLDYEVTDSVSDVLSDRMQFTRGGTGEDPNYFQDGYLVWTSGNNDGLESPVSMSQTHIIELQLKTPLSITSGDTFKLYPGCNKRIDTCRDKFDNLLNYQGFPFMPTNDQMIRTPTSRK